MPCRKEGGKEAKPKRGIMEQVKTPQGKGLPGEGRVLQVEKIEVIPEGEGGEETGEKCTCEATAGKREEGIGVLREEGGKEGHNEMGRAL